MAGVPRVYWRDGGSVFVSFPIDGRFFFFLFSVYYSRLHAGRSRLWRVDGKCQRKLVFASARQPLHHGWSILEIYVRVFHFSLLLFNVIHWFCFCLLHRSTHPFDLIWFGFDCESVSNCCRAAHSMGKWNGLMVRVIISGSDCRWFIVQSVGICLPAERSSWNVSLSFFLFSFSSTVERQRWSGGHKSVSLKSAFLVAELSVLIYGVYNWTQMGRDGPLRHSCRIELRPEQNRTPEADLHRSFHG